MKFYTIAIASDHSGVLLKEGIIKHLIQKNISVLNLGTDSSESVDYPDYASKVVNSIIEGESSIGILICGTGIGMSIAANRNSQIRAALCHDLFTSERARSHNDSNILVLGSKVVDEDLAIKMVDKFLSTKFEGGRHAVRLAKI